MPLYEYQCSGCSKIHEVKQKFSDPAWTNCPDCQAPVQKLMSLSSFALKGSGWYSTDYKKKSAAPANSSETAASGSADTTACGAPKAEACWAPACAAPAAAAPSTSSAS